MSASFSMFSLVRRLIRTVGTLVGSLAFLWSGVVMFVLLIGGFRLEWSGFRLSALDLEKVLPQYFVLVLLTLLLVPVRPWTKSLAFRFPRILVLTVKKGWRSGPFLRVLVGVFLFLLLSHQGLRIRCWVFIGQAERLEGSGALMEAVDLYSQASLGYNPQKWRLRFARGNCLYRAGEYEACVESLNEEVRAGGHPSMLAFRALWKSLLELERYSEAREIVELAMGQVPSIGQECTEILAIIEKRETGSHQNPLLVRFWYHPPDGNLGPFFLAGNWSTRTNRRDELRGFESATMKVGAGGGFFADIPLIQDGDLPFSAFVQNQPGRFSGTAVAHAAFHLPPESKELTIQLRPLDALLEIEEAASSRTKAADGRQRVFVLWPDGFSWLLLNTYIRRGWMPNAQQLVQSGVRLRMRSTEPPYTATAYLRMVNLDAGVRDSASRSFLSTLAIQLKGIPFLDSLFPDDLVEDKEDPDNLFNILASHQWTTANLVFNDRYLNAGNDLANSSGQDDLEIEHVQGRFDTHDSLAEEEAGKILQRCLQIDPALEPERWNRLIQLSALGLGIRNSEEKVVAGMEVWLDAKPDFMLLRLPAVDILSHYYTNGLWQDPLVSPLGEVYRHVDRALGRFTSLLDADDTLVLVSDHGILAKANHHWSCVLIGAGPGLQEGGVYPSTIPIAHFPSFILSRFGLQEGSDRLTDGERALFSIAISGENP